MEEIPNYTTVLLRKGIAYYNLGNYDITLKLMNKILKLNPQVDGAKLYAAKIYFKQENYEEAIQMIKKRTNRYSRGFFDLTVEIVDKLNMLKK